MRQNGQWSDRYGTHMKVIGSMCVQQHVERCARRMIRAQCVLQDFGLAHGWMICMQRWIAVRDGR